MILLGFFFFFSSLSAASSTFIISEQTSSSSSPSPRSLPPRSTCRSPLVFTPSVGLGVPPTTDPRPSRREAGGDGMRGSARSGLLLPMARSQASPQPVSVYLQQQMYGAISPPCCTCIGLTLLLSLNIRT